MKRNADSASKSSHSKNKKKCGRAECSKNKKKVELDETRRPSLLDVLKEHQDCNCEVVARAVASNVHMNLGLTENRRHSRDMNLKVLKKN